MSFDAKYFLNFQAIYNYFFYNLGHKVHEKSHAVNLTCLSIESCYSITKFSDININYFIVNVM